MKTETGIEMGETQKEEWEESRLINVQDLENMARGIDVPNIVQNLC